MISMWLLTATPSITPRFWAIPFLVGAGLSFWAFVGLIKEMTRWGDWFPVCILTAFPFCAGIACLVGFTLAITGMFSA